MSVHDQSRRLTAPDIRARKGGDPLVSLTSFTLAVIVWIQEH